MAKSKTLKATNLAKPTTKHAKSTKSKSESGTKSSNDFDETAIIKKLADNDRQVREKALKVLSQFLSTPRKIDEFKLQKLWKGLFYTMWHSDRPLTQQALAQELADLTKGVKDKNYWSFIDAFWSIMCREWHLIDKHRIDKFYMLIRRYLAVTLDKLKQENWSEQWISNFQQNLETFALNANDAKIPHALRLHMCDILIDEVEKLKGEDDDDAPIAEIVDPVIKFVQTTLFKTVKLYAIANVLKDPRLEAWGFESQWTPRAHEVVDSDSEDEFANSGTDDSEEEDSENSEEEAEEWTGFD